MLHEKFCVLFCVIAASQAAHLPSYITPCKGDDPAISQCVKDKANEIIPILLNGDKNFKLPSLNPLILPKVVLKQGEQLTMNFNNLVISGLDTAKIQDANINIKDKTWTVTISFDKMDLKGLYEMVGKLLVLPIEGKGDAEIKFDTPVFTYQAVFERETRDGAEYDKIKSSTLTHILKQVHYKFENLFNGEKILGDQMNKFMNENWLDLDKDLGPAFDDIVKTLFDKVVTGYFSEIPINEIVV